MDTIHPWMLFLETCEDAYEDPEGYLGTKSEGDGAASSYYIETPDRQIRWGGTTGVASSHSYTVMLVGNRGLQGCEVFANLDGDPIASEDLNEALLKDIGSRSGVVFAGGSMPAVALGAGGTSGVEPDTYRYVVFGALPDQILAEVVISPWSVQIFSTRFGGM
ncbi:hypothetical protein [Maritimibacter sp. DP1N21-5]|uniref:hypothetical protein n=1 Tax=Maritimibacter sp. DP1N21-5 TaxID=2836867 RepID=UPI001C472771|nr:hypothetical protein [Maritimibacter sp. DP1N21-5]MBV7409683.1 hypothetical protein [Maritimibacter sp. DP1N21-5]